VSAVHTKTHCSSHPMLCSRCMVCRSCMFHMLSVHDVFCVQHALLV
jgi:hypothetical protein